MFYEKANFPSFAQECKSVEEIKSLIKNPPKVSAQEYEAILETYSCCSFDEGRTENAQTFKANIDCAAETAMEELKKEKVQFPSGGFNVQKVFKNPSPVVRAKAYTLAALYGNGGSLNSDLAIVKEAFENEKDAYALKMLVNWGIFHLGSKAPNEIGAILVKLANHPDEELRYAVIKNLASEKYLKVPQAVETVAALVKGKDAKFAKEACSGLARFKDESVLNYLTEVLKDRNKHNLHGSCMYGVARLWIDKPYSGQAYKFYMDYMQQKPRNSKIPNQLTIAPLTHIKKSDLDKLANQSYFKADEVVALMTEIVQDADVDTSTRNYAVNSIAAISGKAGLEKLAPIVEGLSDKKASSIQKNFQKALSKAK